MYCSLLWIPHSRLIFTEYFNWLLLLASIANLWLQLTDEDNINMNVGSFSLCWWMKINGQNFTHFSVVWVTLLNQIIVAEKVLKFLYYSQCNSFRTTLFVWSALFTFLHYFFKSRQSKNHKTYLTYSIFPFLCVNTPFMADFKPSVWKQEESAVTHHPVASPLFRW